MIVVDASVLVKVLTGEPGAERALTRIVNEEERIAPDWIRAEIASALVKKALRGELNIGAVLEQVKVAPTYLTAQFATLELLDDAFMLAIQLKHAIHDCLYLALAERQNCTLVTADKQFVASAKSAGHHRLELI